MKHYTFSFW